MPVKIHNKKYYTVAERIDLLNELLHKQEKTYSLTTELISWENEVVIMKATLTITSYDNESDAIGITETFTTVSTYTGHAYEKEDSSQINRTSALENCETSAIGRALSAAGFGGGNEYASANEVENAIHQQKFNSMTKKQAEVLLKLSEHEAIEGDTLEKFEVWIRSKGLHSFEDGEKAVERFEKIINDYDGLEN
jgi:hypothetical protein